MQGAKVKKEKKKEKCAIELPCPLTPLSSKPKPKTECFPPQCLIIPQSNIRGWLPPSNIKHTCHTTKIQLYH